MKTDDLFFTMDDQAVCFGVKRIAMIESRSMFVCRKKKQEEEECVNNSIPHFFDEALEDK